MTRPPTAAQRRVIDGAEAVTGRLRGTESQLAALVRHGLAFRHPRPPHDHFLTPAGHLIREETATAGASAPEISANSAPAREASGVFTARVGGESGGEGATDAGPARVREVRSAWQGLLELRRMTSRDGVVDRPCAWERTHLVQAAALALEAAGLRPAGAGTGIGAGTGAGTEGYRVRATPQPEAVAVHEPDARALSECAATLEKAGWQVSEHAEPRTGARYLLASPRRS
ncbi:hypothetical protein ACFFS2_00625 [Streptomyces aurantiacus]|uniref:Uncharacterized protein n=1 Tax=Streptomyces aurantiacus TaxID=47760 RepID=A0A7G1NYA3_9ACTN|nr:hypothetical protein [Streptomyces aurantiacus]BCL26700.1 hypothetical protein GCM10017557_15590 [Streptomyces aurantiacus]